MAKDLLKHRHIFCLLIKVVAKRFSHCMRADGAPFKSHALATPLMTLQAVSRPIGPWAFGKETIGQKNRPSGAYISRLPVLKRRSCEFFGICLFFLFNAQMIRISDIHQKQSHHIADTQPRIHTEGKQKIIPLRLVKQILLHCPDLLWIPDWIYAVCPCFPAIKISHFLFNMFHSI
ncbi:hypothetical protein [Domibacillus iocasae]|uniref:hypothetical protein n=1 Tax=Domibacillus iocasae TaxID=1714016 RepID=UPI001FE0D123|nr:hypothetical protein [Domibacillus iocasae]